MAFLFYNMEFNGWMLVTGNFQLNSKNLMYVNLTYIFCDHVLVLFYNYVVGNGMAKTVYMLGGMKKILCP